MKTYKCITRLSANGLLDRCRTFATIEPFSFSLSDGERTSRSSRASSGDRFDHANSLLISHELLEHRLPITNHELPITSTNRPNLHPTPPITNSSAVVGFPKQKSLARKHLSTPTQSCGENPKFACSVHSTCQSISGSDGELRR
jgi:hypothetical protein